MKTSSEPPRGWTFLTNHARVFLCLFENPNLRLREVAARLHVTERAVQNVVNDLADAGYVRRVRRGNRNTYELNTELSLRGPVEAGTKVGELAEVLANSHAESVASANGGRDVR